MTVHTDHTRAGIETKLEHAVLCRSSAASICHGRFRDESEFRHCRPELATSCVTDRPWEGQQVASRAAACGYVGRTSRVGRTWSLESRINRRTVSCVESQRSLCFPRHSFRRGTGEIRTSATVETSVDWTKTRNPFRYGMPEMNLHLAFLTRAVIHLIESLAHPRRPR